MKYIKSRTRFLTEAIESINISKTINFLKSKVKSDSGRFLEELKRIIEIYDYPLSKVKDENIKYMSKWSALKLKPKSEISNYWGIDCLKYWFSLEDGYLGYTATGNKTFEYKEKISNTGTSLTDKELSYLKSKISEQLPSGKDYTIGKFVPVANPLGVSKSPTYEELKTGDVVVGYFNSYDDIDYLTWAVIYVDDDKIYAIQNVADGSFPDSDEWTQYGQYSWVIYMDGSPENDHIKLHKYVPSSTVLSTNNDKSENPLSYNLPLRGGNIKSWTENYNSIRDENQIDKADFCLVMYLDDMMDPDKAEFYERPSDMRKERGESREGATALMSDEEIREMNISRYITQLIGKLGISPEKTEFKDLNKLVLKAVGGKFALIGIIRRHFSKLQKINDYLYDMIQENDMDGKKEYFNEVLSQYENSIKSFNNYNSKYIETEKFILEDISDFLEDDEKELFLKQWNKCVEISNLITSSIQSKEINTIEDLRIITHNLASIYNIIESDRAFQLSSRFYSILKCFDDSMDVEYDLKRMNKDDLTRNEPKLKNLENLVIKMLK
jgi:hypothetical protein